MSIKNVLESVIKPHNGKYYCLQSDSGLWYRNHPGCGVPTWESGTPRSCVGSGTFRSIASAKSVLTKLTNKGISARIVEFSRPSPDDHLMTITNESELVDQNIAYHRSLNPVAWKGIKMRSVVRQHLLIIAEMFVEFLNIPGLEVKDVVLTGSNANYNWTRYSDFDIHVVVDYSAVASHDVAMELFNAKKELWNSGHNIKVKGYDVELYVEDTATPPVSQGVYSLINGTWLRRPEYTRPAIDDAAIEAKATDLMMQIDHVVETISGNVEDYNKLADKIKKMRKSGLADNGEFSTENLAFKILRNEGYIGKLHRARQKVIDDTLTLEGERNV